MKKILILTLFFLFLENAATQTLIPFLGKNGLIGLADESGKLLIESQFTEFNNLVEPDKPSFYAKKNGETILVLRNGMQFPARNGANGANFVRNFDSYGSRATDTIRHLVAIEMGETIAYVNTQTGKKVEFLKESSNGLRLWFPVDFHALMGGEGNPLTKFRFGCQRVIRPGGILNFIDTSLNLMFREDFAAATVVDPQFFIVANAEKKFAIADRTGRIRTKFKPELVVPTEKSGYFISNPPIDGYNPTKKGNVGLMDADGKFIIEPKFDDIRPGGDQFLIVKTVMGEGLMDYAGNMILSPTKGEIKHAFGDFFILKAGGRSTVINSKGELQLPGDFQDLSYTSQVEAANSYFQFTDGPTCGVFSSDFRLIFRDTCGMMERINFEKKTLFKTHKSRYARGNLIGLIDVSGKELLPRKFLSIAAIYETGIVVVKTDSLAGLFSFDGQWILPCEFWEALAFNHSDVLPDGSLKKTLKIFGKKKGANRWLGFDKNGNRLPENDCFHPMNQKDKLIHYPPNLRGDDRRVVFADGTEAIRPNSWIGMGNLKAAETPVGLLILKEDPTTWDVLDKKLGSVLPSGFWIPRNEFYPRNIENISLVAVWQKDPNEKKMPSPVVVPDKPVKKQNTIQLIEEDPPPMVDAVVDDRIYATAEESSTNSIGGGVINALGEWVIKPTTNARFQPISWNLVIEYALSGTEDQRSKPRKLHRVNHPKPAIFDIVGVEGIGGQNIPVYQNVDDPAEPGKKVTLQAYFSRNGDQLTPAQFSQGNSYFKNRTVIRLHEKGKKSWIIINEKAQKVADLSDLDDTGGYFLENGYMAASKSGKWGVIDSNGREVLPFNFQKLSIVESGHFLQEKSETNNKYRLLDWKGQFLAESESRIERRQSNANCLLIVLNYRTVGNNSTAETLIFSNDGVKIGEIKGLFYSKVSSSDKDRFGQFISAEGKQFFVDLKTGREYRE